MYALVVREVEIADLHPDFPERLEQIWGAIIVQNYLMQVLELLFLEYFQLSHLLRRQQHLQRLADLTLNTHWHVLFDEVLDHCKVVRVVLRVVPQIVDVFLDPVNLLLEPNHVLLLVLAVVDQPLLGLEALFKILE